MKNFVPAGLAVLALLALAGCAGAPLIVPYYDGSYMLGEERGAGNVMPVILRGNPFAIPQAEFDADVTNAMEGWAWYVPLTFTTSGNPNAAYRVVMVFNPPAVPDYTYCLRPMPVQAVFGTKPGTARTPLTAVFCRGDTVLASASGSIGSAEGPRSANFRWGIGHFTQTLFPASNPEAETGGCASGPDC